MPCIFSIFLKIWWNNNYLCLNMKDKKWYFESIATLHFIILRCLEPQFLLTVTAIHLKCWQSLFWREQTLCSSSFIQADNKAKHIADLKKDGPRRSHGRHKVLVKFSLFITFARSLVLSARMCTYVNPNIVTCVSSALRLVNSYR